LSILDKLEATGWNLVKLGIAVPRSHFCICCLTFDGPGMQRNSITYCLPCWERRQKGELCGHLSSLPSPRALRAS
jgi:hypothetical protein